MLALNNRVFVSALERVMDQAVSVDFTIRPCELITITYAAIVLLDKILAAELYGHLS